jgi:hypothetical protein
MMYISERIAIINERQLLLMSLNTCRRQSIVSSAVSHMCCALARSFALLFRSLGCLAHDEHLRAHKDRFGLSDTVPL